MVTRQENTGTQTEPVTKSSFVLPKSLHTALKIAAIHEAREMKELVADAIAAYLRKNHAK